jgi:flagellar basal-body rod protein FlgC
MEISKSIDIAASALTAQSERMKVISQNIANADSTATTAGGTPYQRKTVSFKQVLDRETGVTKVAVDKVGSDTTTEFGRKYDPANPVAGADGYVQTPNVNPMVEMTDMKEAKNAYEANLTVIDLSKTMVSNTLNLLRN